MICSACAHENRPGAKFCEECASPLARACASCGGTLGPTAKFCDECGTPAAQAARPAAPSDPAGTRKVVSIVFADLVGSTALHERLDPESARRFMESYYDAMRGAVESHGGTVTQLLGDGVKAVFGIPRVAEDDAIRAVRAAVAMQTSFRALAEQQRGAVGKTGLRVAVNTGEVVANDAAEIIGDPVNVAARLQEQGQDGDVVVGEPTHRLVSTLVTLELLGSLALKGRSEAVRAYRLVSLERPAGAATAPFVGRIDELARLAAVYDTAIQKPAAGLAVLVGSPGLGKSRLIDEFARRHADAAIVVQAHCDAAGGATFAPLAEALRELLGIEAGAGAESLRATIESSLPDDTDRARIAGGIAALVAGSPPSPEETFFVVRRLFAALAQQEPVVLVIDDLQWAEPLLIDLVEHLIQWGSGVPLLVLIGARPELRELRSSLVTSGGLVSDVVTLAGLDAGAAMRLAANAIGAVDLPSAVAAKVLATSEGNPLFVGELVRMLVQEGALTKEGEHWIVGANLAALEMPPTIHALLAARIERLGPEERAVLERAAVVGRHFSRSTVAALLAGRVGELDAHLEALRRSELIERDTGWLLGEPVLRFHHVLIRDAAYRRLLKGTRADLHAQLADWIEAQVGDAPEHDETIGRHLEQAHQLLRELGPLDARAQQLGARAATRLAAAGRRALAGDDLPLAASLLGRALERLDRDDPARAELALDWCEALLAAGDVGQAAGAIDELARFAAGSSRLEAWHACFAGQHTVLTAPSALHATAAAVAAAADSLAALGDEAGEAKGHFVHALALSRLGQVGACEAALDRALAAARRAGDRRRANTVLAIAPLAALWGPSPVTRASGRCLDVVRVLRITQGAPAVEAVALSCQGVLEALRGRTDAARRMIASARKLVEELGITQRLLEVEVFGGLIQLLEGDPSAAERSLRGAYGGLRDLGLGIDAARAAALLARTLLAQDRVEEAEALSHESEALAGDDLKAAIAWRGVRAEALARRGEHAAAVEFASRAVELAAATDALLDHADARLALAAALRAAGRDGEADSEERRARALWEEKGATLLSERLRDETALSEPFASATAPTAADASARSTAWRRAVRPNFAVEETRRVEAAVAARDVRALEVIYRRDVEIVDHPHGVTYGHVEIVERMRSTIEESTEPALVHETLATFGDALALCRLRSTASGSTAYGIPTGATEVPYVLVIEADEQGRARRIDIFAEDKLDEAIAVLYERHAELLPEGPARARAAVAAASFAVLRRSNADPARLAPALAPEIEGVDHRHLANWSLRGAEAYVAHLRALQQVASDVSFETEEVLAVAPNAMLARMLHRGTDRVGGGAYERAFLSLFAAGADGRLAHAEWFDDDREAEALARFEALDRAAAPAAVPRRVRPNAATESFDRIRRAIAARDADAIAGLFDETLTVVHHPTHATYGRRGMLTTWRSTMRAERLEFRQEILASLGETLALDRHVVTVDGLAEEHLAGFGSSQFDQVWLLEVDELGHWIRLEIFAAKHLGEAIARLYERHAERLPEGAERRRSAGMARSIAAFDGPIDTGRIAGAWHATAPIRDHRVLATWATRNAAETLRHFDLQLELAPDFAGRYDDVLALAPDACVTQMTYFGTSGDSGGAFENPICILLTFDADGLIAESEVFEPEQVADALARFDARTSGARAPAPHPFENAAARADRVLFERFHARDWAGIEALAAPGLVFDERRRMLHNRCGRDVWLEQFRVLFDVPASRFTTRLLATRGELLSLNVHCFSGEVSDGGGPLAMDDHFALHEVDAEGRIVAIVLFDVEDEAAAYAELDVRFDADPSQAHGRTTVAFDRAIARRDWEAVAALCSSAFIEHDHRSLAVLGTTHGAEAWMRNFRALVELAPDTLYRTHHARGAAHGFLSVGTWQGSREGGPYEIPLLAVCEVDGQGAIARADLYEPDQESQALVRLRELDTAPAVSPFANAASRAADENCALWMAADWDRFASLFPADFRLLDRRRDVQLELGRDETIAFSRSLGEDATTRRIHSETLATRGERLALQRWRIELAGDGTGPSEVSHLDLMEVDERGLRKAVVRWDDDAIDAAWAELDARFEAGEAAAHPYALAAYVASGLAMRSRDWDALASLCAPTFRMRDHRLLGWGTMANDTATYVRVIQSAFELAPDAEYRDDHLRICARGMLVGSALCGTREGGAFENPYLRVTEVDRRGRILSHELYDTSDFERALARFEEIRASDSRAPRVTSAQPNAASAAMDRWAAAYDVGFDTGDWEPVRAVCAPGHVFDDRRRLALLSGDRELMVASARERAAMGARPQRTLLCTAGDRVAVETILWSGGPADGPFEIEYVGVIEVDTAGRISAFVLFDADDARAAQREAWARWAAIQPELAATVSLVADLCDGFDARDGARVLSLCADDLVYEDHRRTGVGRIDGAAAFVESLEALWELAPATGIEFGRAWPAIDRHGAVTVIRRFGTLTDGGAFESEYLELFVARHGRATHLELFELEHLDAALARFEALAAERATAQ